MSSVDKVYGDRFAAAPPGHSLTTDNTQWPWGQPPQFTDPEDALEDMLRRLSDERKQNDLLKLLIVGVSIQVIIEGMLFKGFQDGRFTPDVAMLIKAPLSLFLANFAEENQIPYRLFENDMAGKEESIDDETFLQMLYDNNPTMFETIQETVNAAIRAGRTPPEEKGFLTGQKEEPK